MNKIVIKSKNYKKFSLYCPFTNEKLFNDDSSFEVYEGAGNYLFSACEDCLFFDAGNNEEIEEYWKDSAIEAIEKFVENHKEDNILVIEVQDNEDTYWFGFINEDNIELEASEIENRFIK
ncbi:hypothetical protein [Halarcobacter sp.]|uniref:hypothetical protein n=1 Tax=Halarcobacter sp. TaxID=2321133 RepID=UPI0029F569BF|nr:hypothetical protein [Halarcobacter sp.]